MQTGFKSFIVFSVAVFLVACQKQTSTESKVSAPAEPKKKASWVHYPEQRELSATAQLGKKIFFDTSLSASGKMSCATCHDPGNAYAPNNNLAVQLGGEKLDQPGTRVVPSLRYMSHTPFFTRHYYVPSPSGMEDEGPTGGFTQDGSAKTLREQASIPLLSPNEMANINAATVANKVKASAYASEFIKLYGEQIFNDPNKTLEQVGRALEAFQLEDSTFHPYTSKFDAVMSGNAKFTEAEMRGYRAFKDPSKGNCAKCHMDNIGAGGRPAQFTDFSFSALGVPRNQKIPANRDARYFDMGLCGPFRKDLINETDYCGMFKTPTLRNVSTRKVFFHNGHFNNLEDVVRFYVERDIHPEKWYPKKQGKVQTYDDLPKQLHINVNHMDAPFFQQKDSPPALNDAEIKDMIEFLGTLTDGYSKTSGGEG